MWNFPLFPDQASTVAGRVDAVFLAALAIAVFFTALICFLILFFAIKYRRGSRADRSNPRDATTPRSRSLWIGIPLLISLVPVRSGRRSSSSTCTTRPTTPPRSTCSGKQWMWELQHPEGQREINELHVPAGPAGPADDDLAGRDPQLLRPGVPHQAGRACPGATRRSGSSRRKPGTYHLFCAEYCGTKHSGMIGWVVVMEPAGVRAVARRAGAAGESMAERGRAAVPAARLQRLPRRATRRCGRRCSTGVYGHPVPLETAASVRHGRRALHPRLDPAAPVAGRGRLRAGDADLPGPDQRGRAAQAHRLHQVARRRTRGAGDEHDRSRSSPRSPTNYLTAGYGV